MEVVDTKLKKQSISDIWQSLKNQFASTPKCAQKSQTNWNAFCKKTESSRDSILTSVDSPGGATTGCETQPFILGILGHHSNTTELDDFHEGLRSTARAVLRSLEEEKQAREVLVNLEEEKKSMQAVQVNAAVPTIFKGAPRMESSYDEMREQLMKTPAVKNNDDTLSLFLGHGLDDSVTCVQNSESNVREQANGDVMRSSSPEQDDSLHLIKVNSTYNHLKYEASKSFDGEGLKDLDRKTQNEIGKFCKNENSATLSDLDLVHHNSIDSKTGLSNRPEEQKNKEIMQDIRIILDGFNNTCKPTVETSTASLDIPSVERNHQSALCTLNVHSSDIQDELPRSATDEELMKIINKDVNCLHDSAIDVRYEALHSLHRALLGDLMEEGSYLQKRTTRQEDQADDITSTGLFESAEKFAWCVEEVVVKPLLKIFSDTSERCRYLSISMLIAFVHSIPRSVITLLPYIIPVISSRLPIKSLPTEDPSTKVEVRRVEKSEDIRQLLVILLHELLKASKAMIHPFASDTATILTSAACDSSPEVLMETFAAMTFFGEICGMKLKPIAKILISVVIRSLSHNRHRVRVAAIRAIHRLVLCGAHESIYDLTAFRDPNTVPIRAFYHPDPKTQYLALLAGDRSIQVREQLLKTVASWLQELDERKEHECRLVPYLLSGFTDENPIIQNLAFELMQELGHKYEEENESEVKDTQIYLPQDIDDLPHVAGKPLPPAFKSRPCLGARILVRSCCLVMLHALTGDLDSWTSGTKSLAADFLHTMLLFVEEHITMHLQQVIVMFMKAWKDPLIETKISNCANVLGHFVDPSAYLSIILPRITGELYDDASVSQLAQAVKTLAKVMQGSHASRLTSHIPEICSVLSESDLMKSIQWDVNQSIVEVAREMVKAWSEQVKDETISLLWILLNAAAAADLCGRSALEAESTLQTLAGTCGKSANALIGTYGEMIFDMLPHPQFWAMRSLDVLIFCRVVQVAPLLPTSIIERMFLKIAWFGQGSRDLDTKLWLLRAVQKIIEKSVATPSASEQGETIGKIEEGMTMLLGNFLVPCLEQVREGMKVLRAPTLETIFVIISRSSSTFGLPPSLARALFDLERFEHKQEVDQYKEEDCSSQETLLEILARLRGTT